MNMDTEVTEEIQCENVLERDYILRMMYVENFASIYWKKLITEAVVTYFLRS